MRPRLLIATTVPDTFIHILRDQPRFLNQHMDVDIVSSPSHEWGKLTVEGVGVHAVPMWREISPIRDLLSVFYMVRLMHKLRPDVVHSYTPKAGFVCMLAAWVCRIPVRVHTFTGLIWPTSIGWRRTLLKTVDRLICACATEIVPEGEGVLRDLKVGKITDKPLRVIGHGNIAGVDIEYFSSRALGLESACTLLRQNYKITQKNFVFIFVGRLNRDKGIKELLDAFMQLPNHCRLLVVGALDYSAPISARDLDLLHTHTRVHFMGFQQDIRPAVLAADVLVLPSYREGFPNILLQAGAMERPAIATDISGCNEVLIPGLNGWLVPIKNSQVLASTMHLALSTPLSVKQEMGRLARVFIVERFERALHWQRMLIFYRNLFAQIRQSKTTSH